MGEGHQTHNLYICSNIFNMFKTKIIPLGVQFFILLALNWALLYFSPRGIITLISIYIVPLLLALVYSTRISNVLGEKYELVSLKRLVVGIILFIILIHVAVFVILTTGIPIPYGF